jgi:hypothetical protein
MQRRSLLTLVLTVLAYVIATFGVQGASHFVVNANHYAAISIMRAEPIIPMGIASMVVQGLIFAWLFPTFNRGPHPIRNGVLFSCTLGAFLASYIVLGEAGKYSIPSIGSWIVVELSAAVAQYVVFGVLLGLLHRKSTRLEPTYQRA